MSETRKVGTYVVLKAQRLTQPLTLPAYTNAITGEAVPAAQPYGVTPLGEAVGHQESLDGTLTLFGGEWTAHQMFGLALLSHADGTGGKVLTHTEAVAVSRSEEWRPVAEEE